MFCFTRCCMSSIPRAAPVAAWSPILANFGKTRSASSILPVRVPSWTRWPNEERELCPLPCGAKLYQVIFGTYPHAICETHSKEILHITLRGWSHDRQCIGAAGSAPTRISDCTHRARTHRLLRRHVLWLLCPRGDHYQTRVDRCR